MIFAKSIDRAKQNKLPGNLNADDIYLMTMLHRYQRKNCSQLARQFGITRAQAYDILAKRSVGGCCG